MKRVFLDLDGVMYDFEGHFKACFGQDAPNDGVGIPVDEMWALIHGHGSFYETMPLMTNALHFFRFMIDVGLDVTILTAASKNHFDNMAGQKMRAVRRDLSKDVMVICTPGSSKKQFYLQNEGDILIDDFPKNILRWNKAGGFGVLHEGNWNQTYNNLYLGLFGTNPASMG